MFTGISGSKHVFSASQTACSENSATTVPASPAAAAAGA